MLGRLSKEIVPIKEKSISNAPINEKKNTFTLEKSPLSAIPEHNAPIQRENKKRISDLVQRAFDLSLQPKNDSDYQEIVDLYEEVLRSEPDHEKALEYYSNYLILQQELDLALPIMKKCLEKYPKNELCNGNLLNYYLSKNQMKDLEKSITNCLSNLPDSLMCLFNQGQYYLSTHQYKKSLEVFQRIDRDKHNSTVSYTNGAIAVGIAQSYEGLKNKAKAKDYHAISCHEGNEYSCKWVKDNT